MSEKSSTADHILIAGNPSFPGSGAQFSGASDRSAYRQPAGTENGAGQFPWHELVPSRIEEIAMRGNGYVLAVSGGIAVCAGALLPFIWHAQASIDGAQILSGFGIGLGYHVISFLFGALLAGLAYWTRRNPARRRGIAMGALVTGVLGFVGYALYALVGINGLTVNSDLGPPTCPGTQASACCCPSRDARPAPSPPSSCAAPALVAERG